jgi:hypothetical protein
MLRIQEVARVIPTEPILKQRDGQLTACSRLIKLGDAAHVSPPQGRRKPGRSPGS